ncbi:MAG: autotransporter outer membrane beta-barrel domain-containing protein [Glaciimonas sp.]|nr:autotransporter outer membrane beta-barrel domain-containing protein [Glaciimonas sp.]
MMGSTTDQLEACHADKVLSAYLETGFNHAISGNFSMTPFAGVSYNGVNRGSFTELYSAFGLKAKNQYYQQVVASTLGLRTKSHFSAFADKSYVQIQLHGSMHLVALSCISRQAS